MNAGAEEATLEPRLVGDIRERFFVPDYQRGYRWGRAEVERLLDDIWEKREEAYYLQPVVVKKRGDEYELVDGQQRLTTLFLILQYMKDQGLKSVGAEYSLRYETREETAAYLQHVDPSRARDNIDFFHIHTAYECIATWFEREAGGRRQFVADEFYGALFKNVRVIWYEAPDDIDGTDLFTRLNVGRIPLTDAELVKAQLLSQSTVAGGSTNRALEMAAQWDSFERDLRNSELWAFITGRPDEDPTHISLLFDTLAGGPQGRDRPLFHTFETLRHRIQTEPHEFWNEVIDLHSLIVGWFEDRTLFHKIGFLVASGRPFSTFVALASGRRKSDFEGQLDTLITQILNISEDSLSDLAYDKPKAAGTALLLFNVETIRARKHSDERYSFREHAAGRWTLEHIHARSAEQLTRTDQWTEWLKAHRAVLTSAEGLDESATSDLIDQVDDLLKSSTITKVEFQPLERAITELLSDSASDAELDVDAIDNLALLDGRDNSALSNSVFAVKRAEVLSRDKEGSYIPVCTRNVFLKYYSSMTEPAHFWTGADREAYLREMKSVLRPYLRPKKGDSE